MTPWEHNPRLSPRPTQAVHKLLKRTFDFPKEFRTFAATYIRILSTQVTLHGIWVHFALALLGWVLGFSYPFIILSWTHIWSVLDQRQNSYYFLYYDNCASPSPAHTSAYSWDVRWPKMPHRWGMGKWIFFAYVQDLLFPSWKEGEKCLFPGEGMEGSWALTLTFWTRKTSLRGLRSPGVSVMT